MRYTRTCKRFGTTGAQNVRGECQERRLGNPHLERLAWRISSGPLTMYTSFMAEQFCMAMNVKEAKENLAMNFL